MTGHLCCRFPTVMVPSDGFEPRTDNASQMHALTHIGLQMICTANKWQPMPQGGPETIAIIERLLAQTCQHSRILKKDSAKPTVTRGPTLEEMVTCQDDDLLDETERAQRLLAGNQRMMRSGRETFDL